MKALSDIDGHFGAITINMLESTIGALISWSIIERSSHSGSLICKDSINKKDNLSRGRNSMRRHVILAATMEAICEMQQDDVKHNEDEGNQ